MRDKIYYCEPQYYKELQKFVFDKFKSAYWQHSKSDRNILESKGFMNNIGNNKYAIRIRLSNNDLLISYETLEYFANKYKNAKYYNYNNVIRKEKFNKILKKK